MCINGTVGAAKNENTVMAARIYPNNGMTALAGMLFHKAGVYSDLNQEVKENLLPLPHGTSVKNLRPGTSQCNKIG